MLKTNKFFTIKMLNRCVTLYESLSKINRDFNSFIKGQVGMGNFHFEHLNTEEQEAKRNNPP